jgi:predicted nucleotidyltransferase
MNNPLIEQKLPQIVELCRKYHVDRLYLFGSATTDRFNDRSDIDFLYSFDKDLLLLDYVDNFLDFAEALQELMGREIDLVGEKDMHNPYFIASVERSKQLLYAA